MFRPPPTRVPTAPARSRRIHTPLRSAAPSAAPAGFLRTRECNRWDAERIRRAVNCTIVGMSEIKRRRLEELDVHCHPGTKVGEYVPFYFCFRSIMLFLLY